MGRADSAEGRAGWGDGGRGGGGEINGETEPPTPVRASRDLAGREKERPYFITGMTNSAPSFTPDGQREVTVFVLV
jgi:hypothetical protein